MLIDEKLKNENEHLRSKIEKIKIVVTDNDGVLTDTGVYFSAKGEELKRFSIRDGMGVERLRKHSKIETIIITGEISGSVKTRAEKLKRVIFKLRLFLSCLGIFKHIVYCCIIN